jgi:hypothetical protein
LGVVFGVNGATIGMNGLVPEVARGDSRCSFAKDSHVHCSILVHERCCAIGVGSGGHREGRGVYPHWQSVLGGQQSVAAGHSYVVRLVSLERGT